MKSKNKRNEIMSTLIKKSYDAHIKQQTIYVSNQIKLNSKEDALTRLKQAGILNENEKINKRYK